jgi:hypothetical protein
VPSAVFPVFSYRGGRCVAQAARRTLYTASGASAAIASTVSRRGWRRRHGTPMTIPATEETSSDRRKYRDSRRAAGVAVPPGAGPCVPGLRNSSLCHRRMFSCTSAGVGASVPRQLPGRLACVQRHQSGPAGGGGGKLQRPLRHPARPVAPGEAAAGPTHLPPARPSRQTLIAGRRCASAWPPEASQGMRNV